MKDSISPVMSAFDALELAPVTVTVTERLWPMRS